MRLKQTNSLYWNADLILSCNSNTDFVKESINTISHSYFILPMDPSIHQLISTIHSYQILLRRYAGKIVKNKLVASLIVEEVISNFRTELKVISPENIRKYFHQSTYDCCQQWLKTKNKTLYQRKPKNPT